MRPRRSVPLASGLGGQISHLGRIGGVTARGCRSVLLRLTLGLTNTVAMLRLLPRNDRDKDIEVLVLRHQLAVLQHQFDGRRIQFQPADRALLAALLHRLPRSSLRRLRLRAHPDTILAS